MTDETMQRAIVRKGLLVLWGMGTLILFFCVILLTREIIKQKRAPQAMTLLEGTQAFSARHEEPAKTARDVLLYFANRQATGLVPERRSIEFSDSTVENCRQALDRLIEGPQQDGTPILPVSTHTRGMYLLERGELVIDFSRDLEAGHVKSASAEWLMVKGIVATLSQPTLRGTDGVEIRRVRFLFEGSLPQETFPAHLDLSEAVHRDAPWLAIDQGRVENG